jgi:tRNA/tmRNA/rRNA uracil-C5-methylase (TrmA/RlmC/RlmD family)
VAETGPLLGAVLELDVGEPAAGGACVARHGDDPAGRVVFVRHALPGERVRARVVEDRGGSFCRADAIEILRASPDRVTPPCPHAGPGRCGGCDWQHVTGAAQRELKATVLRDQFARLANLDVSNVFDGVEELLAHPDRLRGQPRRPRRVAPARIAPHRAPRPLSARCAGRGRCAGTGRGPARSDRH